MEPHRKTCDCEREREREREGERRHPRTLSRDLIADIIADLELLRDFEHAQNGPTPPSPSYQSFPHPGHRSYPSQQSHHRTLQQLTQRASSIYSNEPLSQADLGRIRRVPRRASTVESSNGMDTGDFNRQRRGYSHDFVNEVMHAYDHAYDRRSRDYSVLRHESIANTEASASLPSRSKHVSGFTERFSRPNSVFSQPESKVIPPTPTSPLASPPMDSSHSRHTPSRMDSTRSQQYPSPAKTAVIMFSLYISIFLVALDRTILGPAIPEITNQFRSISDIGWYGSAYMLTSCGFILLYGRVYTFFPTKPVFLSGILLFEIGSAICGAATSSMILILGRAIAGFGSSGIFTGAILIMLNTVPLHRRPMLQGLFGACFGVASVAGPLLGGAFTGSKLTWRWCFYINLPLGGFTVAIVMLFLHLDENKPSVGSWKETLMNLDPLGTLLFLPSITCLLLALEWGAAEKPWDDPQMIALFVVFSVLFVAFIAWQYYTRDTTATVPARILFQRSVAFGGASQFCVGSTMLTVSMYVPLWFQAIKDETAMKSGINMIPLVLSVVVGSIMSGGLVQRIGYYTPFMILGSCFMAVGSGLLTTWNVDTPSSMWIGFQVILGFGVGCTMQHPNLAVQVVLPKQDVPTGTALLSLCQTLGGAVFVAVGQNVFMDKFTTGLEGLGGVNASRVVHAGATTIKDNVPLPLQRAVLGVYNTSLTKGPFFAALIVACLSVPAAMGMQWRSVKEKQPSGAMSPPRTPPPPSSQPDVEMQGRSDEDDDDDDAGADADVALAALEQGNGDVLGDLEPPKKMAALLKLYRSSGMFSSWMTARINPDLENELRNDTPAREKSGEKAGVLGGG